jgi:small subunit ribosomal protein S6
MVPQRPSLLPAGRGPAPSGVAEVCRKTTGPWGEVTCRVRKYEFVYILDSTVDDAAVAESLTRYTKLIRDQGGEVIGHDNWGRRKFAYDILKKTEGSYLYIKMRATNKVIEELNRVLHFDEKVLRSLIVLDEDAEARNAEAQKNLRHRPDHDMAGFEQRAGA